MKTELDVIKSHIFIKGRGLKDVHGKSRYWCLFFHLFCPLQLRSALWRWLGGSGSGLKAAAKTHSSSIGNLCPFAQLMSTDMEPNPQCKHKGLPCVFRWSLRSFVLLHFLSFVRYRSIFQCPPTHPLSSGRRRASLGFEHITSGEPTQLINSERVIAGKEWTLARDMRRQKQKGLIWEMVLRTEKDMTLLIILVFSDFLSVLCWK